MANSFQRRGSPGLRLAGMSLFLALVTSCGFHPRGSVTALTDLGSIYIDAARSLTITESVEEALIDAAFTLAPDRDAADILLRLTGEVQNQRVVSVKSTGRVNELELSHSVDMLIVESQPESDPTVDARQALNRVESMD